MNIEKAFAPPSSKKNSADFVQITRGYLTDISKLSAKSPIASSILFFLVGRMTKTNAVVISQRALAEFFNVERVTINRAIAILKKQNWVQVIKLGTTNGYIINSRVFWRSYSGKRYTAFYSEVIATETEQAEQIENKEALKQIPKELRGNGNDTELAPPENISHKDFNK